MGAPGAPVVTELSGTGGTVGLSWGGISAPCRPRPLGRDCWGVGAGRTVCQKRLVQGAAAPLRARLQPLALLCSGLSHR